MALPETLELTRPADQAADASADDRQGGDREIVYSVLKAFDVLKTFSRAKPRMTLSEVAEYAGMTRATARRFLLTFVHAGYMVSDGKRYQPTPKLLELGQGVFASMNLWEVARPAMEELAATLGESCYGAILDGSDVFYVVHIPCEDRLVNIGLRVGSRLPAYCTSIGRLLWSGMSDEAIEDMLASIKPVQLTPKTVTAKAKLRESILQARSAGWSIVDEELELGLRSISVPIRSGSGDMIAAINVCAPSSRVSSEEIRGRFLPAMLDAAEQINRGLRT